MDNLRVILWVGLGMMLWLTMTKWQAQFAPVTAPPTEVSQALSEQGPAAEPVVESDGLPDLHEAETGREEEVPTLHDQPAATPSLAPVEADFVRVRTDVLDVKINTLGADLQSATLLQYPVHKDKPNVLVSILSPDPEQLAVFRTGLRAADDLEEPNHLAVYQSDQKDYQLSAGSDELLVSFTWVSSTGLEVEKIYRFGRGRYDIQLEYRIRNKTSGPYRLANYLQLRRIYRPLERSMFNVESYSFNGPVIYDGEKYEKLKVDDLAEEPYKQSVAGGWLAAIQHHFLAAAVPPGEEVFRYQVSYDGAYYTLSAIGQLETVAPGATTSFSAQLFVGPKLQKQLAEVSADLPLTVDYGKLTILAQPLFWILQKVFDVIGNWGWTIIIVTLMIKLVFYKLTETSGKSMAKMRKLQPRLKAIQERYKDDRAALSQAMMELYKREKVNPAAGCLPMLIQIPFFIAFYWVLLESVEMRQAPFLLWITDLSEKDPYFILPLIMGAAMYFQQKLNPTPPDPIQAKVMSVLPIVFTGMFAFFPAGLVLYWVTNSLLTILQQWRINKVVGAD